MALANLVWEQLFFPALLMSMLFSFHPLLTSDIKECLAIFICVLTLTRVVSGKSFVIGHTF